MRALVMLPALAVAATLAASPAAAAPTISVDVETGRVLAHEEAFRLWAPASLTKLMTALVAFRAVERGEATMETPVVMSEYASAKPASKMWWKPGTTVPLRDAIEIIIVKSGNDVATAIAETIGGTELEFVEMMNEEARALGMVDTAFGNASGLPDPRHVTTARDMAVLARAIRRDFPQYDDIFELEGLDVGAEKPILSYNLMLGRFEGADGMKTGFVCASGFNIVNSATRPDGEGGERTIVSVVLGAPDQEVRAETSAALLQTGFDAMLEGAGDAPTLETFEPYEPRGPRADITGQICTDEARANRYDGRDVEGRMVLDTPLITPRQRAPIVAAIDPMPPLPLPKEKPKRFGGTGPDAPETAEGEERAPDAPLPHMNPAREAARAGLATDALRPGSEPGAAASKLAAVR